MCAARAHGVAQKCFRFDPDSVWVESAWLKTRKRLFRNYGPNWVAPTIYRYGATKKGPWLARSGRSTRRAPEAFRTRGRKCVHGVARRTVGRSCASGVKRACSPPTKDCRRFWAHRGHQRASRMQVHIRKCVGRDQTYAAFVLQ